MKRFLIISGLVVSMFATDYQVGIGYGRNFSDKEPFKAYNYLNIRVGKYLPKNHILRVEIDKMMDNHTNLKRALINVEHYFDIDSKITPYAFIGVGYQWIKDSSFTNAFVGDLGIGARYAISENLKLFLEARAVKDFDKNRHYGFLGGIVYDFGFKAPKVEKAEEIKPVVVDSDEDGVVDNFDKCPHTPSGIEVNRNGCPIDSDKDGVADYLDKCPNTPNGMVVDKSGCAIEYKFNITFDTNKADIKPQFISEIKKFAEFLKAHPNVKAEIQGYTDNRGNSQYNLALSKKRAKAVYDALIKLGVNPKQLRWAGYGSNNNVASNNTSEGREQNRRVIAKIIY